MWAIWDNLKRIRSLALRVLAGPIVIAIGVGAGVAVAVRFGDAEDGVPLRVDGVFAVELEAGELVGHDRAAVPEPLHGGCGLAAEPEVVPDGAALLQSNVVHAVAKQVRWH